MGAREAVKAGKPSKAGEPIKVSKTAQYVALYRALETIETRRAPLFQDPFAEAFLSRSLRTAVQAAKVPRLHGWLDRYADSRAPGARTSAIARTAFIDEIVRKAVNDGTKQLVVLGAGYDCRAHRMRELEGVRVFEVDRAATQSAKRTRLESAETRGVRNDVRYVAVDFLRDDTSERLTAAGWERTLPTIFIWEGVTNYLTEGAVESVFTWIGRSAPSSHVVFTYIHGGLLDGTVPFEGGAKIVANVRSLGEPWTFGLHPEQVGPFLGRFGLELREDLGADEYRRRYLEGTKEDVRGYAFYRIAVAAVPDVAGGRSKPSS